MSRTSCAGSLDDAAARLQDRVPFERFDGSHRARRSRGQRDPPAAVPRARLAARRARPPGRTAAGRPPAQARPRQLPHRARARAEGLLRRRARDAVDRLARRRRRVAARRLRPPRDGARDKGYTPLPPPRLRRRRHRADARSARPPRPPRPLARLGPGAPRRRRQHRRVRADRRGGVLRRALLRHGAAGGRSRAAHLARRPLLVEHLGAAAAALVLPLRRRGDRVRAREPRDAGGDAL